jgi:glycosyltransferase involved in cell wall biosynthesis
MALDGLGLVRSDALRSEARTWSVWSRTAVRKGAASHGDPILRLAPHVATFPLEDIRSPQLLVARHDQGRHGLRIVMVVANDVTRDSRVLREASVLARAGHQVTVLGIMNARTEAPALEVRDGFVIHRLPFRARPPAWWVPPDFYGRIRQRAVRQYRIHRSRLGAVVRRGKRQRRIAAARFRRIGYHVHRAGRLLDARIRRHRVGSSVSRRSRPTQELAGQRRILGGSWRTKVPRGLLPAARTIAPVAWGVVRQTVGAPVRVGRALWRAIQAWAAILTLLGWGTLYLLANRTSGGALEWLTGWRWRWLGWARYVAEHAQDADVWHGHDLTSLPAVVLLKRQRGGMAVYDSHEIYLESGRHALQPRWAKARLEKLERTLASEVDAVITVNRSLAAILAERLGRTDIEVLYNCPPRASGIRRTSPLRRALGLPRRVPLLLYHGSLAPHRGVEQLLDAIQLPALADAHLAFLGFGPLTDWLRGQAADQKYEQRVHVVDAVSPDDLPAWLVGVDVAVAPIQASTLNHRYSSPNKVFEAIAAGTPVAGSDFPEFRSVIADPSYGPLGTLFDSSRPAAIAEAVRELLDLRPAEKAQLRRRCQLASERRWNWETESVALLRVYDGFAQRAPAAQSLLAAVGAT